MRMAKKEMMRREDNSDEDEDAPGGGFGGSSAPPAIVADRKDFDPLCTFTAGVCKEGKIDMEFKVKDNLTRYR